MGPRRPHCLNFLKVKSHGKRHTNCKRLNHSRPNSAADCPVLLKLGMLMRYYKIFDSEIVAHIRLTEHFRVAYCI